MSDLISRQDAIDAFVKYVAEQRCKDEGIMRIGLIDVDGHNFPNLALMKLSAWHKANGDHVEWYEPMFSGHMDVVYMSKVFSFSPDYEYCIDADKVIKGGSGYCISLEDGREVYNSDNDQLLPTAVEHIYPDYSLYPQFTENTAFGFLTRGCPRDCSFCHVSQKEGRCSFKVADLTEFWHGQRNIVLCDPNLLACPDRMELLDQLIESEASVEFNQGLDVRLLTEDVVNKLKQIRLKNIHFAFDRYQDKKLVMDKLTMFKELTGFSKDKGRVLVYILVNFDTTLDQDIERIQFCRSLKFAPYVMIYDKQHCDPIYKKLQRWANNYFVFWKVENFEDYTREKTKYEA